VVGLSIGDGKAVAEREIGGGSRQVVEMPLPFVSGARKRTGPYDAGLNTGNGGRVGRIT